MLASTPPMGWNSWDCYGTTVTEEEVLANAEVMASRLLPHGWDTVVVDIQWYEPTARAGGYNPGAPLVLDEYGRPQPAPNRFPSAVDGAGFAPLASRIHDLGLRFGVHLMRGIPRLAVERKTPVFGGEATADQIADRGSTCVWNSDNFGLDHDHVESQLYYDGLIGMLAGWGVDFIKVDDMLGPYHGRDIQAVHTAVQRSGRDMIISLSPGRQLSLEHTAHLREHAHMWRISDDLWDRWDDLHAQFERLARWASQGGPGAWPDADMLPLGRIGLRAERGEPRSSALTADEQRTMMSLWCIARSPLMMGGDLPSSDEATFDLLTNDAVLDVLRSGTNPRQVLREGDLVIWVSELADGAARFAAVFDLGDRPLSLRLPLSSLGIGSAETVTELWTGERLHVTTDDTVELDLPPHGATLLRLRPSRG